MILLPDGATDPDTQYGLMSIHESYRKQMWQTMIARWAAFPNVFWIVENDQDDTLPKALPLGKELSCYFSASPATGGTCAGITAVDPWRQNRPFGFGHERDAIDAMRSESWLNYITAYGAADLSAQQMDGSETRWDFTPYSYTVKTKPVFYSEDFYEQSKDGSGQLDSVQNADPQYFYRRLFWSYLLSGSGVTYGSGPTWLGLTTYSTTVPPLTGLTGIGHVADILARAHVDLNLFKPQDLLVGQPGTGVMKEFNRVQVAANSPKEILAYIPNTVSTADLSQVNNRRQLVVASATAYAPNVFLTEFKDEKYSVTWYNPATGDIYPGSGMPTPTPLPGGITVSGLKPPFPGDAILHLSSRCTAPNVCEPMDSAPPAHAVTATNGIHFYADGINTYTEPPVTLALDQTQYVIGNAQSSHGSWRCDRKVANNAEDGHPGCILTYVFSDPKERASIDYYFKRNSRHAHQHVAFITTMGEISFPDEPWGYRAKDVVQVGLNPEQDVFSQMNPDWGNPYEIDAFDVLHGVPVDSNRWYHLSVRASARMEGKFRLVDFETYLDGKLVYSRSGLNSGEGDKFLKGIQLHAAWWGPIDDLSSAVTPTVWLDELSIDPPADTEHYGLYHTYLQQGLGEYEGTKATYFDSAAGYDGSAFLRVGANNSDKSLLRFAVSVVPANAIIDEATLALFYTGRSNANGLTLGAHDVLADWAANVANRTQRQTGINWQVVGMGAGSDYTASPAATLNVTGEGNAWIELDVTDLAQTWVSDPSQNHGLVLLQEAASGSVVYSFCSEVAQAPATPTPPCLAGHAPKLTLRYHLVDPTPTKATFQRGANGYTGNAATYFDGSGNGYNSSAYLRVSADGSQRSLLRFDVSSIPITETVAEATLRVYPISRSNANNLTIAAHRVLVPWTDSQANRTQRQTNVNWQAAGLGAGSDYALTADGTVELTSAGVGWVELDVTRMVREWAADPASNHGLVLLAQAAGGVVNYGLCSELGWTPCTAAQAPILTVWHYPPPPPPEPEP